MRPTIHGPFATRNAAVGDAYRRMHELVEIEGPNWDIVQSYRELLGTAGYNPLEEDEWDLQATEIGWETTLTIHEIGEVN